MKLKKQERLTRKQIVSFFCLYPSSEVMVGLDTFASRMIAVNTYSEKVVFMSNNGSVGTADVSDCRLLLRGLASIDFDDIQAIVAMSFKSLDEEERVHVAESYHSLFKNGSLLPLKSLNDSAMTYLRSREYCIPYLDLDPEEHQLATTELPGSEDGLSYDSAAFADATLELMSESIDDSIDWLVKGDSFPGDPSVTTPCE